jgi:hypothetical protein
MARRHYANAIVSTPAVKFEEWMDTLRNQHEGAVPKDHVNRIAKTILRKCDPNQYLLSHATIVASVDTYEPKGVKTGRQMNQGVQIDVRWPDFRIKPECHELINNNGDMWERSLLLSTYRTFIGAPNYCFTPDTKVLMADGTQQNIEDINVGDEVIGGSGLPRKVVYKHVRDYEGEVKLIYTGHNKTPIVCTPNHPFARLDETKCVECGCDLDTKNRPTSYKKRLLRKYCTYCGRRARNKSLEISVKRVAAENLEQRAILFAPIPKLLKQTVKDRDIIRFARLMGFYLAEGCILRDNKKRPTGICFSVGTHENDLIQQILDCVRALCPKSTPNVALSKATDKCTQIRVYNSEISAALEATCGSYAHAKKISQEWMNAANPDEVLNLIGSYISGDADVHKISQRVRLCSVSLDLLQQVQFLGSCVGLSGFIVEHGIKVGNVSLIKFADGSIHEAISQHQAHVLHFDVDSSKKICNYATAHKYQKRSVAAGDLKFLDDKKITFVNKIESDTYSGKVFNLEVEEDHSYIISGIVQVFNCEHIQLPELSKGFIADAIVRDLGKTCYVDILVATEKKHKLLVQDILAGTLDSLSMGCISLFTICTKCGNVAADDASICSCILYGPKGSKYIDEDGIEQPIAELIGHVSVPNSNQFIEASWVHNPAFRGAVRRNILNADMTSVASKLNESAILYELRREQSIPSGVAKAASLKLAQGQEDFEGQTQQDEPGDALSDAIDDSDDSSETAPAAPSAPEAPESDSSIDELLETAQKQVMQIIVDGLSEKLSPKPEDVGTVQASPPDISTNDNLVRASKFDRLLHDKFKSNPKLIKWASQAYKIVHIGGQSAIRKAGLKPKDLIILSWIEDRVNNKEHLAALYKIAIQVGPLNQFPSKTSYIACCKTRIGRSLTEQEKQILISKALFATLANH